MELCYILPKDLWQDTGFQSGKDDAKPTKKHLVKPVLVSGGGNRCHTDSMHFSGGDGPSQIYNRNKVQPLVMKNEVLD